MKKNLFILPGYLVGIGSLILITYRTVLAFFSGSKSITIHVNRYGEQYGDIAALVFIWVVCVIGLFSVYFLMKEQKGEKVFHEEIRIGKRSKE
jgi:glutamate mutase epsilon subunit